MLNHNRVIRNIFFGKWINKVLYVVTGKKPLKSSSMVTLFSDPVINKF